MLVYIFMWLSPQKGSAAKMHYFLLFRLTKHRTNQFCQLYLQTTYDVRVHSSTDNTLYKLKEKNLAKSLNFVLKTTEKIEEQKARYSDVSWFLVDSMYTFSLITQKISHYFRCFSLFKENQFQTVLNKHGERSR